MERRLSVAQLAQAWGCSRQHVYNLIEEGKLRSVRIGSLIRIRPEDAREYECRDQEQTARPSPSPRETAVTTFSGGKTAAHSGYHAALRLKQKRAAS